jgi:hypothetical protein
MQVDLAAGLSFVGLSSGPRIDLSQNRSGSPIRYP